MEDISIEDKVKIASGFLLASPPGEVNDVFNDVRTLVDDDKALESGILTTLEEYNTEQLITVIPPGLDYEVIVSKHGKVDLDRYLDPRSKKSFQFDHIRLVATELKDHTEDLPIEDFRAAVETEARKYVNDHYPNGVCSVYGLDENNIAIAIVDNKYNPNNYWNGRWLATWVYNRETGALKGATKVHVHYYEDGNVQLNSDKKSDSTVTFKEDVTVTAKAIVKEITTFDKRYHTAVNNSYEELAENAFKGLRRALPLTRNKLDWNKIMNYKIGNELSQK